MRLLSQNSKPDKTKFHLTLAHICVISKLPTLFRKGGNYKDEINGIAYSLGKTVSDKWLMNGC